MLTTETAAARETRTLLGLVDQAAAQDILRHPTRRALYDAICSTWGLCETELGHLTGLGRNNVKYHLQRMARARLVHATPTGRKVHYFPRSANTAEVRAAVTSLQSDTRRRILELVRDHPELSLRAVSREVGVTPRAVRWHIQQLTGQGLVEVNREGARCHTRIGTVLADLMRSSVPDPPLDVPGLGTPIGSLGLTE